MSRFYQIFLAVLIALISIGIYRNFVQRQQEQQTITGNEITKALKEPRIPRNITWETIHRIKAEGKLFSIPDIHGDYEGLLLILKQIKLIHSETNDWIGGNSILVQTGDILDRGDDSADALRLLAKLQLQAKRAGGRIIVLMGNHELLNIMGRFHYATPEEDKGFAPQPRELAFDFKKGEFGAYIRSFPAACVVERSSREKDASVLFVHGGLSPLFLTQSKDPIKQLNLNLANYVNVEMQKLKSLYHEPLLSEHGPMWNRFFALGKDEAQVCSKLQETLDIARAGKMVVGHTVQTRSNVGQRCGGRLVLSDVSFRCSRAGFLSCRINDA
jgi:hypothetical protein